MLGVVQSENKNALYLHVFHETFLGDNGRQWQFALGFSECRNTNVTKTYHRNGNYYLTNFANNFSGPVT